MERLVFRSNKKLSGFFHQKKPPLKGVSSNFGARGRNRTGMHVLYAADFKSAVSTDFTTRAREGVILPYIRGQTLSVLINSYGYNQYSVIL